MKSAPNPQHCQCIFSIGVMFCLFFAVVIVVLFFVFFVFHFTFGVFAKTVDLYQQTLRKKIKAQSLRTITEVEYKGTPTDSCLRIQQESRWRDDADGQP